MDDETRISLEAYFEDMPDPRATGRCDHKAHRHYRRGDSRGAEGPSVTRVRLKSWAIMRAGASSPAW